MLSGMCSIRVWNRSRSSAARSSAVLRLVMLTQTPMSMTGRRCLSRRAMPLTRTQLQLLELSFFIRISMRMGMWECPSRYRRTSWEKKAWSSSWMVSSGWVKILGAFSLRLAPIMVRQRSV